MPGRLELDFSFGKKGPPPPSGGGSRRLLLVGDFSGRSGRIPLEPGALAARPLVRVDIDRWDEAMTSLNPQLTLELADARPTLAFPSLDAFHPDRLYEIFPAFAGLRELRARLLDHSTFAETAARMEGAAPPAPAPAPTDEDEGQTLSRLLGGRRGQPASAPADTTAANLSALLREAVARDVRPDIDSHQKRLVGAVDEAASAHLRALLHHGPFQRLEARWRALHRLVSAVDPGPELTVFVLDAGSDELAADLAGDPTASALARRLSNGPWSLVAVDTFIGPEELGFFARLGAAAGGSVVVAGAAPALLGYQSLGLTPDPADWQKPAAEAAANWEALCSSPLGNVLALAAPRFLARQPYGAKSDPIESFAFEELAPRDHDAYLWANPAFAVAQLVGAAVKEGGAPGDVQQLEDLPAHTYKADGEVHLQSVAETYLGDRGAGALDSRGVIPLVSARDRNILRIPRLQTLSGTPFPDQ